MSAADKRTRRSRNKLGKGLSALVDASQPSVRLESDLDRAPAPHREPGTVDVVPILLSDIYPNKNQPRKYFDEESLGELAASIKSAGLMQPIVVRPRAAGGYELIAGERRWRACGIAGLERVPAVVHDVDDRRSAEWALIENIQREDLNAIEKAKGYRKLIEKFGLTQQEVGDRVGASRASVANIVRLLDLDDTVQEMVIDGRLSVGHAKALLQCADTQYRLILANTASGEGWTVRALERAASNPRPKETPTGDKPSAERERVALVVSDLERQLGEYLGTRVRIASSTDGTKGRVQIEFYDLDHFDGLMSRMGFSPKEI
ncbi:MAG: ParB/RepB/Spo0J family partition protein [Phycisphaerales bacterium]|nr:ParB/RepB/Spo0J family partition protein [Phycisphaerales bacterium]